MHKNMGLYFALVSCLIPVLALVMLYDIQLSRVRPRLHEPAYPFFHLAFMAILSGAVFSIGALCFWKIISRKKADATFAISIAGLWINATCGLISGFYLWLINLLSGLG
jgi:hypothetical protein